MTKPSKIVSILKKFVSLWTYLSRSLGTKIDATSLIFVDPLHLGDLTARAPAAIRTHDLPNRILYVRSKHLAVDAIALSIIEHKAYLEETKETLG